MRFAEWLLYALFLTAPLGQFSRLPLGSGGVNVYGVDLLMGLCAGIFLIRLVIVPQKTSIPRPFFWLILFCASGVASLVWNSPFLSLSEQVVSSSYLIRFFSAVCTGLLTAQVALSRGTSFTARLAFCMVFSGVLVSLLGIGQLILLPDFTQLDPSLGWDPHQSRLSALFFDPNFTGAYLVCSLAVTGTLLTLSTRMRQTVLLSGVALLLSVALVLTFSRSAYLMGALVLGLFGVLRSPRLLAGAVLIFLIALIAIPRVQTRIAGGVDPDDSARARFVSWQQTATLIGQYPIVGVGFNAYRYAQEREGILMPTGGSVPRSATGADSSLLFVWATTGVFGLVWFLLFLGDSWLSAFRRYFGKRRSHYALPWLVVLPGFLVESQFINALFYPWLLVWWLPLAALSLPSSHDVPA